MLPANRIRFSGEVCAGLEYSGVREEEINGGIGIMPPVNPSGPG